MCVLETSEAKISTAIHGKPSMPEIQNRSSGRSIVKMVVRWYQIRDCYNCHQKVVFSLSGFKAVVLDWPLNIYTYSGCQKEFPQDKCKSLQS